MPAVAYKAALGRGRTSPATDSPRVPMVARLLALAHQIEAFLADRSIESAGAAASLMRVTRARVTQIRNLTLLAPDIQDEILGLRFYGRGRESLAEHRLRPICAEPSWRAQRRLWARLKEERGLALSEPKNAD